MVKIEDQLNYLDWYDMRISVIIVYFLYLIGELEVFVAHKFQNLPSDRRIRNLARVLQAILEGNT